MSLPTDTAFRPFPPLAAAPAPRRNELPFALLAHPTVQAVRFLTKAALAWFLVAEHFGEVMLAGLLVNLCGRVAVLGLDEAIVYARRPDRSLWRKLRRTHHGLGLALMLPAIGFGFLIGAVFDYPVLSSLTLAMSPWIFVNNAAALPAAWLVRRQAFRQLFWIDLYSIAGFSATTLGLAAAGADLWAVIAGWYAQALVRVVLAHRYAAALAPPSTDGGAEADSFGDTLRYGAHVACSQSLGFIGERADAISVGLFLGRGAYGLYDWALHLSHFVLQYVTNLAERVLFPRFTEHGRTNTLRSAYLDILRFAYTFVVPAHVVLAVTVPTAVRSIFPETWHASAPLIALFGLAAGAMCLEVIGTTALKAAGHSRAVARLAFARVGFLATALLVCVPLGTVAVAAGIACARVASTIVTNVAVSTRLGVRPLREEHPARQSVLGFSLWAILFSGAHSALGLGLSGLVLVAVELAVALVLWIGALAVADRRALGSVVRRDWKLVTERVDEDTRRAA